MADLAPTPWKLRPYQVDALRSISQAWSEGQSRTMIVLATGLGKTTVFAEVARRRHISGRKPTLVLVHRIELAGQASQRLRAAGLGVSVENGDRVAWPHALSDRDVVVATVQTLRGARLKKWPADYFDTVVADECHHAAAASWRAILDRFETAKHLGVTATPDRGDAIAIGHVYPHLAYSYGIRDGITDGFLAPIRSLAIDTPSVDLSSVRTTKQEHGRDLSAEDLAAAMRGEEQLHEIAAPIAREGAGRQTLVFVPSVEIAHSLAEVLTPYVGAGRVKSLDGGSDRATRADVIAAYQRGDVQVLVNCALFTEGFDAPTTSCVAIARPTKSRALYAQMVGRGTRIAEGKTDCLVLNLRPEVCAHSLISPLDIFDGEELPDDLAAAVQKAVDAGEPVMQAIADAEEASRQREAARQRDRDRARIVADVHYRKYETDPFEELGIDGMTARDRSGPRATEKQAAALERQGFTGAASFSRREASKLMDELVRRSQRGLCTIKMMRKLKQNGLRGDLSFEDARSALDALSGNRWKVSPDIAEKWGESA
jgi:superfamily II DNA or RNA helicase